MKKAKKPKTIVKKEVPLHEKNYKKTVAKARRVHEKKTLAQQTNYDENTHRKRKWQAEQLYELQDPAVNPFLLKDDWMKKVKEVFEEATLPIPEKVFMQSGGKEGKHTEHLGFILTELQYMQRAYPDSQW